MPSRGELRGRQVQPRELAGICFDAGWTGSRELVEAIAVCLAESQGYTQAINKNLSANGTVLSWDLGIFQINRPTEEPRFYDPEFCARWAHQMYTERGWQPWVAFNKGIAMDTRWWNSDGEPTGRYIHRARHGVHNYLFEKTLRPVRFDMYIPPKPS